MVKEDLGSRIDSQIMQDPILYLKVNQLRARNKEETARKSIKRAACFVGGVYALAFGGSFLYKHPEYFRYIERAGQVVKDVIEGFCR